MFETRTSTVPITKEMVKEAYRKVKANHGAAGVDKILIRAGITNQEVAKQRPVRKHAVSLDQCIYTGDQAVEVAMLNLQTHLVAGGVVL